MGKTITMTIDDASYERVLELADPQMDRKEIFVEAIRTFIQVRAARRLAALGGTIPEMKEVPRNTDDLPVP